MAVPLSFAEVQAGDWSDTTRFLPLFAGDLDPLFTVKEAAVMLGRSAADVSRDCAAGLITHEVKARYRDGRPAAYLIPLSSLRSIRRARTVKAA